MENDLRCFSSVKGGRAAGARGPPRRADRSRERYASFEGAPAAGADRGLVCLRRRRRLVGGLLGVDDGVLGEEVRVLLEGVLREDRGLPELGREVAVGRGDGVEDGGDEVARRARVDAGAATMPVPRGAGIRRTDTEPDAPESFMGMVW